MKPEIDSSGQRDLSDLGTISKLIGSNDSDIDISLSDLLNLFDDDEYAINTIHS